jgi:predicted PurR-regulated permease PerM
VVRDIQKKTGWNAEEMFDVGFNSWNLKGLSKAIKSAQNMCLNKPKNGIDLKTTGIISLILLFFIMFFILREKKSISPERKLAKDLIKNIKKSKPKSKTKNEPQDEAVIF